MGVSINTRQAYSEVDEFLGLISNEHRNKIPKKLREFFREEKVIETIDELLESKLFNWKYKLPTVWTSYFDILIFIIVSNPVDSLTYLVHQMLPNYPKNKIIGMGGTLDSARFGYYLSKEFDYHEYCDGLVVGGHGDVTMVPVVESATKNGQRVYLDDDVMSRVIEATKVGGATLTKLLGTSAWLAPGVAIAVMVNAIVNDLRIYLPCSIYREEYCCCIGTNCMLGANGVEGYEVNLSYESSNPAIYDALERISMVNAEVDKFLRNDSLSSK